MGDAVSKPHKKGNSEIAAPKLKNVNTLIIFVVFYILAVFIFGKETSMMN